MTLHAIASSGKFHASIRNDETINDPLEENVQKGDNSVADYTTAKARARSYEGPVTIIVRLETVFSSTFPLSLSLSLSFSRSLARLLSLASLMSSLVK